MAFGSLFEEEFPPAYEPLPPPFLTIPISLTNAADPGDPAPFPPFDIPLLDILLGLDPIIVDLHKFEILINSTVLLTFFSLFFLIYN